MLINVCKHLIQCFFRPISTERREEAGPYCQDFKQEIKSTQSIKRQTAKHRHDLQSHICLKLERMNWTHLLCNLTERYEWVTLMILSGDTLKRYCASDSVLQIFMLRMETRLRSYTNRFPGFFGWSRCSMSVKDVMISGNGNKSGLGMTAPTV